MFRRDVKKHFNETKYNLLTKKGNRAYSYMTKIPFQKSMIGTVALFIIGFNYTKRYFTFPHAHKDPSQPMLMYNGELHPYEDQPKGADAKNFYYTKHIMKQA